jgi:membrane protein implicated in regulation of membrane protease activity
MPTIHWSSWLAFGICGLIGILAVALEWPWWVAVASVVGFPVLTVFLSAAITARRRR